MKRFMILAVMAITAISFTGCGTIKVPYRVLSHAVDYGRYYDENFFISESNSVSFEYEPAGTILVSIQPGYEVLGERNGYTQYGKDRKLVSEYDVLDQVKQECEQIGANGIINLKISYGNMATSLSQWDGTTTESATTITVTGMAIKRK